MIMYYPEPTIHYDGLCTDFRLALQNSVDDSVTLLLADREIKPELDKKVSLSIKPGVLQQIMRAANSALIVAAKAHDLTPLFQDRCEGPNSPFLVLGPLEDIVRESLRRNRSIEPQYLSLNKDPVLD